MATRRWRERRWRKYGGKRISKRAVVLISSLVLVVISLLIVFKKYHGFSKGQRLGKSTVKLTTKNVMTAANWHRMATCETVPESYYNLEYASSVPSWCNSTFITECKHPVKEMIEWFSPCQGTIWIRLQSGPTGDVHTFIKHVLPRMTSEFDLITTSGDNSVPDGIQDAQTLLDSPLLKRWYTQNWNGFPHPKLQAIPIGFEMHTVRRGLWSPTDWEENLLQMRYIRKKGVGHQKYALWIPPMSDSGKKGERDRARKVAQSCGGIRNKYDDMEYFLPVNELWNQYTRYRFGLSPPGNGIDCHRTWEMMYFGMIPIVMTSGLDHMYSGLPVVIVKDWTDLCQEGFLDQQYARLKHMLPLPEEIFTMAPYLK